MRSQVDSTGSQVDSTGRGAPARRFMEVHAVLKAGSQRAKYNPHAMALCIRRMAAMHHCGLSTRADHG